jgi:hypothetical protein
VCEREDAELVNHSVWTVAYTDEMKEEEEISEYEEVREQVNSSEHTVTKRNYKYKTN